MSHAIARAIRDAEFVNQPYAWVITRDREFEISDAEGSAGNSAVDTAGPSLATADMIQLARTEGRRFRLYDEGDVDLCSEDGPAHRLTVRKGHQDFGLVYQGLIWVQNGPDTDQDFGPLYDFGAPNHGCTEIRYLNDVGVWVTL